MLRELTTENCFSFLNETTVSFLVNQKVPTSDLYQASALETERISKVVGILGPNASGKSNLLRVLEFLKTFIIDSYRRKPDAEIGLVPFLLKEKPFDSARIEVEFECGNSIYRYKVVIEGSAILHEELNLLDLNQSKERKRFKQLFSRTLQKDSDDYQIKAHMDFKLNDGIRELASKRKNASLISAALLSNHEPSLFLKKYWERAVPKIKDIGSDPLSIWDRAEFYHRNEKFKLSMERVMAMCDLGIVGLDIERIELPQMSATGEGKREFFTPWGRHPGIAGKEYRIPFMLESAGTQQLFVLLSTLLPVLDSGGLAIIDELETDLHPDLLPTLLDLFASADSNPKGAQLIFTTHSTPLLKNMDRYQVFLVKKDKSGISHAVRADHIEGSRSDDNLFAKYEAGAYGSKPDINRNDNSHATNATSRTT